ncbi:MAG: hypothetical protein ABI224_16505 [Acetobacteraceae bacterium]
MTAIARFLPVDDPSAKSAAGMMLTEPGLAGIVAAAREGRVTFQRILTYTLNSVTKKTVTLLLLTVGLVMTGHAILNPLLMVILPIAGDFLAMSLTTDNLRPSPRPSSWRIRELTIAGAVMGPFLLAFGVCALAVGKYVLGFGTDAPRALTFLALVFGSRVIIYTPRKLERLWDSCPSNWVLASSVADVPIASVLVIFGLAMAPLPIPVVACTLAAAAAFAFLLDVAKRPVFSRLQIA